MIHNLIYVNFVCTEEKKTFCSYAFPSIAKRLQEQCNCSSTRFKSGFRKSVIDRTFTLKRSIMCWLAWFCVFQRNLRIYFPSIIINKFEYYRTSKPYTAKNICTHAVRARCLSHREEMPSYRVLDFDLCLSLLHASYCFTISILITKGSTKHTSLAHLKTDFKWLKVFVKSMGVWYPKKSIGFIRNSTRIYHKSRKSKCVDVTKDQTELKNRKKQQESNKLYTRPSNIALLSILFIAGMWEWSIHK